MADNTSSTPLWLDIKTEYIDENFEKVLDYLYKGSRNPDLRDSFYDKTVELLGKRVSELLSCISARPVYASFEEEAPFETRLLGMFILVRAGSGDPMLRRATVTFLGTLSAIVPDDYARALLSVAVDFVLGRAEEKLPFSWTDIITFSPQILAHKIANLSDRNLKPSEKIWYENKGTACVDKGVMSLSSLDRGTFAKRQLVSSIEILEGRIRVVSPKDEKVKQSEAGNIERLDAFTRDFVREQRTVSPLARKVLPSYADGDIFKVCITGHEGGRLNVRSTDPGHAPFEGYVVFKHSLFYSEESDFLRWLPVGETIPVKMTGPSTCSIKDEYSRYVIEDVAKEDYRSKGGSLVLAKYITESPDGKAVWLTDVGYSVYCPLKDGFFRNDFAWIWVESNGKDRYYGYINGSVDSPADDYFDEDNARGDLISGFSYGRYTPPEDRDDTLATGTVKELCRMMVSCQRSLPQPSERYRMLCVAKILAEMTASPEDAGYIDFVSDYLEDLVLFAKGDYAKMRTPVPDAAVASLEPVRLRMAIVEILSAYGDDSKADMLSRMIHEETDPLLVKVATLVQSCNRIDDVISKSMQNVIKREITRCLSVETEGETDLEEENGIYLGIENGRQEFKTSFLTAPSNAREQNQKKTIFKGVCAFLNSQAGGTLYLGVDDLGYVKGLDSDIALMEKIATGNYHGVDGYVRYITDEAKKYFDLGILTHVDITQMYDGKVVALNVTPYEYSVVELEGVAYVRLNSESVVMSDTLRQQLLDRRVFTNRDKAANVSAILEAIRDRRKVIFHGYSSSSSGPSDRTVEPIGFNAGYTHLWVYDLDKDRNAVFRTDRISNVEVLKDRWEREKDHRRNPMDAFHMTGAQPIHVCLQLTVMAKNLLVEEYPEAAPAVSYIGEGRWVFDSDVYSLAGLGRFYIGLASEITILDAPGLKEYVEDYKKKYL